MSDAPMDSSGISPTAHYTGYVWYRHRLSAPAFATREGAVMYHAVRPLNAISALAGGADLEAMLLARHRAIDERLARAIEAGEVGQVVEVACGLSPRGLRFAERYRDRGLTYLEADLPEMAARKRAVLQRAGVHLGAAHDVASLDAFADSGPQSLAALREERLDPGVGTALITEGLTSYFDLPDLARMWRGFARFLAGFPRGLYLTDLHLEEEIRRNLGWRLFRGLLAASTRVARPTYLADVDAARRAFEEAGFSRAALPLAGGDDSGAVRRTGWVRVAEAHVER